MVHVKEKDGRKLFWVNVDLVPEEIRKYLSTQAPIATLGNLDDIEYFIKSESYDKALVLIEALKKLADD